MKSKLHKTTSGFTVIEVLMVLAIASLIMLVVFMTIPQLQRNSRNNQRSSDASKILSAINECVVNNNGILSSNNASTTCLPIGVAGANVSFPSNATGNILSSSGGTLDTSKIQQLTTITIYSSATLPSTTNPPSGFPGNTATAYVYGKQTCNANAPQAGSNNQYVILYNRETGPNTSTGVCFASQ